MYLVFMSSISISVICGTLSTLDFASVVASRKETSSELGTIQRKAAVTSPNQVAEFIVLKKSPCVF